MKIYLICEDDFKHSDYDSLWTFDIDDNEIPANMYYVGTDTCLLGGLVNDWMLENTHTNHVFDSDALFFLRDFRDLCEQYDDDFILWASKFSGQSLSEPDPDGYRMLCERFYPTGYWSHGCFGVDPVLGSENLTEDLVWWYNNHVQSIEGIEDFTMHDFDDCLCTLFFDENDPSCKEGFVSFGDDYYYYSEFPLRLRETLEHHDR